MINLNIFNINYLSLLALCEHYNFTPNSSRWQWKMSTAAGSSKPAGQTRWIVCVSGVKVMLYCALWTWLASWLATMQIRAWNKKHPGALQKEALMSFIWRCITSLSVQSHVYLLYTDPKGRRKLASVSRFS